MSYATLAQVREYIKLGAGETVDDTLITNLIARAQALIDSFCKRTFEASADVTQYLDAIADVRGRTLWLRAEFCALTSVTNGDGTVLATSDYVTEPRNATPFYALTLKTNAGKLWTYSNPENAIVVVGRRAYSTTAPTDIVAACIRLTVWLYRQKDSSADVDRPLLTNDGVTIMPMALPKDVQQMLLPYRRLGMG